ncbi:MAG: hypothetical protein KDB80_17960 [Planctomycetes bacterium]|nr:hypothetical protein [Planctomycetota bacterium]
MRQNPELRRTDPEAGISLLEVMVAVAVILLGFLALGQTIVTTHALKRTSEERRTVLSALRVVGEELRVMAEDAAASDPDTWAQTIVDDLTSATRLGTMFSVRGLTPQVGHTTVGEIRVVTSELTTDADLGVEIGMPRDLDGDGDVNNSNVVSTATMLPMVITLRYRGLGGDRTIRRGFYVTRF